MDYEKILEIIKKLKDSAKRKLIKDIFLLLVSKEKQNNCAELVCPHCNSKYIVKNGKNKDKQRYKCKSCRKSFIPETNTPIYYSKKYLSNYIALFHYIFDKIENSPLLIRGEQPFRNSNFKGRPPIFD